MVNFTASSVETGVPSSVQTGFKAAAVGSETPLPFPNGTIAPESMNETSTSNVRQLHGSSHGKNYKKKARIAATACATSSSR